MFSAYALRVIMFGPQASPVVNAHITWQIGPATYVSTSRSFAYRETHSSSSPPSHSRIFGELTLDPPAQRRSLLDRVASRMRTPA